MSDVEYYEVADLWKADRYLESESEVVRFSRTSALIPSGVATLLDVGAGNGAFLRHLERSGRNLRLAGVERSETAIAAAVCDTPIQAGSAEALPHEDRAFDIVTSMEVIEHLPYGVYERGLAELARVADRWAVVTVPYRERDNRVTCPACNCTFHPFYHMRRFDERVMETLLPGFQVERMEKIRVRGGYPFAATLSRVYRRLRDPVGVFPVTALCPQCGFGRRRLEHRGEARPDGLKRAWRSVRGVLPRPLEARWIAALYRRAG